MKTLTTYINEGLKLGKGSRHRFRPETFEELKEIIRDHIDEFGLECDLNDIDTSKISNMHGLFSYTSTVDFNGNISNWDVSNVTDMSNMFEGSKFTGENGDLSKWNT